LWLIWPRVSPLWRSSSHTVAFTRSGTKIFFGGGSPEKSTEPTEPPPHCRVGDMEFLQELALFGEHLDAVAGAVADIHEPILGNVHAVHGRFEIGRVQVVQAVQMRRVVPGASVTKF
jgi:hypothetical protein